MFTSIPPSSARKQVHCEIHTIQDSITQIPFDLFPAVHIFPFFSCGLRGNSPALVLGGRGFRICGGMKSESRGGCVAFVPVVVSSFFCKQEIETFLLPIRLVMTLSRDTSDAGFSGLGFFERARKNGACDLTEKITDGKKRAGESEG